MFNIGITAARPAITLPTAKLTNRTVPWTYDNGNYSFLITFWSHGALSLGNNYSPVTGEWLTSGATSDFEIAVQGSTRWFGGPHNTWLSMGITRSWALTTDGFYDLKLSVYIRRISDLVEVASATFTTG